MGQVMTLPDPAPFSPLTQEVGSPEDAAEEMAYLIELLRES